MAKHKITITVSEDMHKIIEKRVQALGVTIQEYFRHLIIKDGENK